MPPYEIEVDAQRHILHVSSAGFWDMQIAERYIAELKAAGARVSRNGAASWWLININTQVHTREVSEYLGVELPAVFPSAMTLAVVVETSLSSVQAKRVVANNNHRYFSSRPDAERWLKEMGMPA